MREFTFQATLLASICVKAETQAKAEQKLREALDGSKVHLGILDGAPIVVPVEIEGDSGFDRCVLGATLGKFLGHEHVNAFLPKRPINEKRRVGILLGLATQLDGLVTDDRDAIRCYLRFEERFEVARGFDHRKLGQRQPLVDEGIEAVGKARSHYHKLTLTICLRA